MGYLYTLLSVLSGTAKGYCGKRTSAFVKNPVDGIFISLLRMILCTLAGGLLLLTESVSSFRLTLDIFLPSLLCAAATSCFVVSWLLCVKNGAYIMLDIFIMLGIMIPIGVSVAMFGENIRINELGGILLLLVSVSLLCSYNVRLKGKMTVKNILLLLFCGAANGFVDLSQKIFVSLNENANAAVFNFYSYLFSLLLLALVYTMVRKKKSVKPENLGKMTGYILIMGICLFLNSYFKTLAAKYIPAAQLYPLFQGLALISSSLMAVLLLKEKLNFRGILGILIAFTGLIVINIL